MPWVFARRAVGKANEQGRHHFQRKKSKRRSQMYLLGRGILATELLQLPL